MNRNASGKGLARPAVEELEPRCLLHGFGLGMPAAAGAGPAPTGPVLSGGLPGLTMTPAGSKGVQPGNFGPVINNPYLPLIPGTIFTYQGTKDGAPVTDVITVTHQTQVIEGVATTVVTDLVYVSGQLEERTIDWYAQDKQGNVWYFGERTAELQNGHVVSTEGSWKAGVNGAQAGIVMEAHPQVGDTYQQEFAPGVAQDMATVLSLNAQFTTPQRTFTNCLQTAEFSPLEPGFLEYKYYAPGVGFLGSVTVQGGSETLELVGVTKNGLSA
jgi:hypothetical protein